MAFGNSDRTRQDNRATESIDMLATFIGFFSAVLAIVLTTIHLLILQRPEDIAGNAASFLLPHYLNSTVFFGITVLVLLVCMRLNDALISARSRILLVRLAPLAGLASLGLCLAGSPEPVTWAFAALSLSLQVVIWGAVLSTTNPLVLTFMLMLASVLTGIIVLVSDPFSAAQTLGVLVILSAISWLSIRRISQGSLDKVTYATRLQCIERHHGGRGNGFALVLVGALFGITAVLIKAASLTAREATLTLGFCLLLSGLIIALFYRDLHSILGDRVRRLLAVFMIVGLVPFPFLEKVGQQVCIAFLFVAGMVSLILIISSVLETSRFNQISPLWIVGLECGEFLLSVLVVLICSGALGFFAPQSLMIMIFILVSASSVLQIYINNQIYPLFGMPELKQACEEAPEKTGDFAASRVGLDMDDVLEGSDDLLSGDFALWRKRIDQIAETNKLSLRQKEIMMLLIRGRDLAYITARFSISRSTAKTHVSNLYRKMNIHSKQELIDLMELYGTPEGSHDSSATGSFEGERINQSDKQKEFCP